MVSKFRTCFRYAFNLSLNVQLSQKKKAITNDYSLIHHEYCKQVDANGMSISRAFSMWLFSFLG